MGFLFVKSAKIDTKPQYTGLQIQTASNALPVPILFGTNIIAPNIIWYDNFKTIKKEEKQGGKGGGSVTSVSYSYSADVMLGLCEGPINGMGRVWVDKSEKTIAEEGWEVFAGNNPQDVWPYLKTTKALAYNGLAYLAEANFPLGDTASLGNHNFETKGLLSGSLTGVVNADDADVALLIEQFLSNDQFGTYFPSAYIDQYTLKGGTNTYALQCFCKAMGFGLSPSITGQETAATIIERWLELVHATVIWSDGVLKFIPYSEDNVTGNGFTWLARTAPLYDLTDDDYVDRGSDDPVKISRIDVARADNIIRLEINDRTNRYIKTPVESRDESAIQLFGQRVGSTVQANEVCVTAMAALSGQLMLQRRLYIRNNYRFTLSWEYCLLEPMDVVTLTDSKLGLNKLAVRIVSIEEGETGHLDVIAEDLVLGLSQPTVYSKQSVVNVPINTNATTVNVNTPLIFEAPLELTNGVAQIWVGASGVSGNLNWGGCEVWVSTDNATYQQLGTVESRANQGVLTAALADYTGANPDNTNTASVNLAMSAGALLSTSSGDAQAGVTRCVIDNELFSYTVATLTSPNNYNLTGLWRGQNGTAHAAHANGAAFCRLDDNVAKIDLPPAYIGKLLYIKFVSFNVFGQGMQDISTLTPYQFTPIGLAGGFNNALLNRLAAGQPTDLGSTTTTSGGANLGSTTGTATATINLGAI
jgi:Putative phage tail protein